MIDNGGFVLVSRKGWSPCDELFHAQWVPLVAPPWIVLSRATALPVEEGSTAPYTVKLRVEPTGDVMVRVTSDNTTVEVRKTGRNAASSVDLGFSMTTWNTAQMVEVSAGSDDDGADATAMLTHSIVAAGSADEYDLVPNVALTVTVRDTDPRGAAVTPRTLGPLTEDPAGSTAYTVVLATQPVGGTVTIAITSDDETAVSRALEALTFTGTTWKTAQTVTAVMDDDMVDKEVTLTHALTGADYEDAVTVDPVVVTVDDDEEQAIWVDTDLTTALRQTGPLSVAEDGNARYTVELESAPTDPVVVWIGVDDNPDVHAMPGLLRFDANDWNTAQTVTVRADGNADALADEATLTHRAAGGDYTGEAEVAVTEATQPGVILSREGVTVGEGGRNTYTVRLVPPPAGTAEMTVTSGNTEIAPVAPATLTFGPTTWTTPQAVTAPLNAGSTNRDTTLMHTVGGYGSVTAAVNVRVDTVDTGWFIEIDPLALEVQEEGSPVTYTVALINPRTDALTVSVPSRHSMNSNVSALPSMLTFDTSSSTTPQTVTVRAANDGNTISGTARVDHTITTAASPIVVVFLLPVMVTELEDTTPTLAAVPNQTYQVGQGVNARLGGPATGATCR